MAKEPRSSLELQKQLKNQLGFLDRSCIAFDNGNEDEAVRLALIIRVLVHDTRNSKSLLGQLGLKDKLFLDTSSPQKEGNAFGYFGLTLFSGGPNGARHVARLDYARHRQMVAFEDWWNKIVLENSGKKGFSRKRLVSIAADQDGGAHVDPSLDADYRGLQDGQYMQIRTASSFTPSSRLVGDADRAAIRQIAYEILGTVGS